MKILEKSGNEFSIIALPGEDVSRGDYLMIEDPSQRKKLVVQVYDESYLETFGLVQDIIREEVIQRSLQGVEKDPLQINTLSNLVRDMRLLRCKVRGSIDGDHLTANIDWLPSRPCSKVRRLSISDLLQIVGRPGSKQIAVGEACDGSPFHIYAEALDGALNIITGRKESGKSHLAKLLTYGLAKLGAYIFAFDLNNEYDGVAWMKEGMPSAIADRVVRFEPGRTLRLNLDYLGEHAVISVLKNVLDLPGVSIREFIRIWQLLEGRGSLTMSSLGEAIQNWRCNELVRDALHSRYHALLSSRLFTDRRAEAVRIEDIFTSYREGCAIVISLARTRPLTRRMTVELLLSKLVELLERGLIPPIFLFAEEAHLYLRETYWDDVVTRMRHFGIFPTFITNQPDAIKDTIYRQADNIFLFNFTNSTDLEMISRTITSDSETVKSVVRTLFQGSCLVLGRMVSGLPILVKVQPTNLLTLGRTRLFFGREKEAPPRTVLRTGTA